MSASLLRIQGQGGVPGLRGLDAFQKRLDKDGKMSFDNSSMKSVKLAKGDALDPVKYRAAKALAEKHKVPLEIDRS